MKPRILIVDDSEINRAMLQDILSEFYDITEAPNGIEAVNLLRDELHTFSLVLLDIVMPEMDGFEVLGYMNKYHWIEEVPVVMISTENFSSYISSAYELGAVDFITRPFDVAVVRRRVRNTIAVYGSQRRLAMMVAEQMYERGRSERLMISLLSRLIGTGENTEFPAMAEVTAAAEIMLGRIQEKAEQKLPEDLSRENLLRVVIGLALCRTDKAVLDDNFCRIKEEYGRRENRAGEEAQLSVQIAELAWNYVDLISIQGSKRLSHSQAAEAILSGKKGRFSPLVMSSFEECCDEINLRIISDRKSKGGEELSDFDMQADMGSLMKKIEKTDDMTFTTQIFQQIEVEKKKAQFFSEMVPEIIFVYSDRPQTLTFRPSDAEMLGLSSIIPEPRTDKKTASSRNGRVIMKILEEASSRGDSENPDLETERNLLIGGVETSCRIVCRSIWITASDTPKYMGAVGSIRIL